MPYISIETIVGVVLLAALVGYGYTTTTSSSTSSAGASKSKKKNKKKAKASTSSGTEALVEPPKREGEKQADKANAQSKGDTKPAPGGPAKPAPVKQAASVAKPESKVKPTATQEKPKAWAEVAALPNQ
jgi:type IV secretory pathway TrbL component